MIRENPQLRFAMPVILETFATTMISLVLSAIIGGISGSALAAVALVNSILNVLVALISFMTIGSAVLTSRLVGEGNFDRTTCAVEQSFILASVVGVAMTALCEVTSVPVMRLLLPNAEPQVFEEGLRYYQMLMLSFPLLTLYSTLGGVLRASGDSTSPMYSAVLLNVVQIIAAYLMISVLKMNVVGAGLSYVACRLAGAALIVFSVLRHHRCFKVKPARLLRPDWQTIKDIVRIGAPSSVECVSVQACYLIANSLMMGLGTFEASIYQVCVAISTFAAQPQTVMSTISVTYIGHLLGAKKYEEARKLANKLMVIGLILSIALQVILALLGNVLVPLYTADEGVRIEAKKMLWVYIGYMIPAIMVNVNDPILRTAGDLKYVMWYNMGCCWLVRLTLTWLFCYKMNMGAMGVVLANIINLFSRSAFGEVRILQKKWMYLKLTR